MILSAISADEYKQNKQISLQNHLKISDAADSPEGSPKSPKGYQRKV